MGWMQAAAGEGEQQKNREPHRAGLAQERKHEFKLIDSMRK
jgi:hypothetical protein